MQISRKIYYDLLTGNVIQNTGEHQGDFMVETTKEQDFEIYLSLKEVNPEIVGCIQLEFGQYAQDFTECSGYHVNLETTTLEFSYPDPGNPESPPEYVAPLSVLVDQLKTENQNLLMAVSQTSADMQGFMDYYFSEHPDEA